MKILPVIKIKAADEYTIINEPVASIDLMERAANACSNLISGSENQEEGNIISTGINIKIHYNTRLFLFCGPGNNGGDGLAIARLLYNKGYQNISIYILEISNKYSNDFSINLKRLKEYPEIKIFYIENITKFPEICPDSVIIDSIFGSGLTKPVKGLAAEIINKINQTKAKIVAIDLPSGLFCDESSISKEGAIIEADYTLSFQLPKYSFLLAENDKYVGKWIILDIKLSKDFIEKAETNNYFTDLKDIQIIYKARKKCAHKGDYGHSLLIAGSKGKIGAAVLGSKASLRIGAGLHTTHIPNSAYNILQISVPEAMVSLDCNDFIISQQGLSKLEFDNYNAIAIGPGLGRDKITKQALKHLLDNYKKPIIFDADAINILSENKDWLELIPQNSILTPHFKEFERLTIKAANDFNRIEILREFSVQYNCYVILKGAYSVISSPDGKCFFNSTGNPGMATAGSGDVLTGILLGLFAQKYNSLETCLLGVFIHGLAGDLAARKRGEEALIAGDIIEYLGTAFTVIKNKK